MQNKNNCDCLECTKDRLFNKHISRALSSWQDTTDNLSGSASDFIGGKLVALNPVTVYSSPNGNPILTVNPGQTVGTIFSYVNKDGSVWWLLESGNFVKQSKDVFDSDILVNSIAEKEKEKKARIDAAAKERMDANTNPLYRTGKMLESILSLDTMRNIIIGIIVLIVGSFLLKLFK